MKQSVCNGEYIYKNIVDLKDKIKSYEEAYKDSEGNNLAQNLLEEQLNILKKHLKDALAKNYLKYNNTL